MGYIYKTLAFFFIICLFSCERTPKKLPFLGEHDTNEKGETVYHQIPDFRFLDQDSTWVSNDTFQDKIYVADFFFTSCPTICPIMKTQMIRVHEAFKSNPNVGVLSHSIDPRHDTQGVLKEYKKRLGIIGKSWHFVTGEKEKIYEIAQKSYIVTAADDAAAPGGIVHSGAFVLVDNNRHIRGVYDGTKPESVDKLIADIKILLEKK